MMLTSDHNSVHNLLVNVIESRHRKVLSPIYRSIKHTNGGMSACRYSVE